MVLYILNSKNDGQVFTPIDIVDRMLDMCGLVGKNIFNYKVIEPSFGNGAFVLRIIEKIIEEAKKENIPYEDLWHIIRSNVYGIEKDTVLYEKVLSKIYEMISGYATKNDDIPDLDLSNNFICGDTLEINQFDGKMDIIIGNPPWIRYHNIQNIKERELIKSYSFCKNGNTDIYIAFFEKGLQMLKNDGRLCFITPNSYINTKMGSDMRKYISKNRMLNTIVDFEHKQIFDGFTTYSCITLLTKQPNKYTIYIDDTGTKKFSINDYYVNDNFYFNANKEFFDIINYSGKKYVSVKNGCATLMDKFFIGNEFLKNSKYTLPAIKSSICEETFCFYPYNETSQIVPFNMIEEQEPIVAKYLLNNKEILLKRDLDKSAVWYGFGRSQAISDTYKNKIAINSLYMNKEDVKFYKCPVGSIVYGGLYILGDVDIDMLENILISDEYMQYVKILKKYKSGGYYTIGSKEMENYINYQLQKRKIT